MLFTPGLNPGDICHVTKVSTVFPRPPSLAGKLARPAAIRLGTVALVLYITGIWVEKSTAMATPNLFALFHKPTTSRGGQSTRNEEE